MRTERRSAGSRRGGSTAPWASPCILSFLERCLPWRRGRSGAAVRWRPELAPRRRVPQPLVPRLRHGVPRPLVPWFVYVGMTLLLPAANGATRREGFAEHALITLGVSGALVLAWLAVARRRGRHRRAGLRSQSPGCMRSPRLAERATRLAPGQVRHPPRPPVSGRDAG